MNKHFGEIKDSCPFFNWVVFFFLLSFRSSLYILHINTLSDKWFANIFSLSVGCLFTLLIVSLDAQKKRTFFDTLAKCMCTTTNSIYISTPQVSLFNNIVFISVQYSTKIHICTITTEILSLVLFLLSESIVAFTTMSYIYLFNGMNFITFTLTQSSRGENSAIQLLWFSI